MKVFFTILTATLIFFNTQTITAKNTIDFFEGTLEELFQIAKIQNKAIFVDAYTNGCIPCQKMETEVFPRTDVAVFYNNFFVNYKLDMFSKEGAAFAKKHNVTSYPTYLYFHTDGTFNYKIVGAKSHQRFIEAGKKGAYNPTRLEKLKAEYEAGNRDKDLVTEYLRQLWLGGDPAYPAIIKTSDNSLGNVDLKSNAGEASITQLASNLTTTTYQIFEKNKSAYIQQIGAEAVQNIEVAAAYNSVAIAIETRNYSLFYKIQDILSRQKTIEGKVSYFKVSLQFFEAMNDWKAYSEMACNYLPKLEIKNAAYLNNIAWNFYEKVNQPTLLQKAVEWAAQSIEIESCPYNNDTYSALLQKLQSQQKA